MKALDAKPAVIGLDVAQLSALLAPGRSDPDFRQRLNYISNHFLGRPYDEQPLIGGPDSPEALKISLDAFDCVTYVETVLAAAISSSVEEFVTAIREIRYLNGQVGWSHRNHYMTEWALNNQTGGLVKNLTLGPETVEKERTLSTVAGIPSRTTRFRCFPKARLSKVAKIIETGDIIMFVSTKTRLDVFHIGLLINDKDGILMRHATRTAGRVVEQKLADFMGRNWMSGFVLLRPVCSTLSY